MENKQYKLSLHKTSLGSTDMDTVETFDANFGSPSEPALQTASVIIDTGAPGCSGQLASNQGIASKDENCHQNNNKLADVAADIKNASGSAQNFQSIEEDNIKEMQILGDYECILPTYVYKKECDKHVKNANDCKNNRILHSKSKKQKWLNNRVDTNQIEYISDDPTKTKMEQNSGSKVKKCKILTSTTKKSKCGVKYFKSMERQKLNSGDEEEEMNKDTVNRILNNSSSREKATDICAIKIQTIKETGNTKTHLMGLENIPQESKHVIESESTKLTQTNQSVYSSDTEMKEIQWDSTNDRNDETSKKRKTLRGENKKETKCKLRGVLQSKQDISDIHKQSSNNSSNTDSSQVNDKVQNLNSLNSTGLSINNSVSTENFDSLFTSTLKKGTRKRKSEVLTDSSTGMKPTDTPIVQSGRKRNPVNYAVDDFDWDTNLKKKHFRKSVNVDNTNEDPTMSEEHIKKEDAIRNEGSSKCRIKLKSKESLETTVTCAVCNLEMANSSWNGHMLQKHNNLAWKIGQPPLDLNDQKLVIRVLNSIYKRRLPLHCDICGQIKKSVRGLLSHKTTCQKSLEEQALVRVQCDLCKASLLPVSLSTHKKFCRASQSVEKLASNKNTAKSLILDKSKRQAALKAENLFQVLKDENVDNAEYFQPWLKNKQFWLSPELLTRIKNDISRFGSEKCIKGCNFVSSDAVAFAKHYQNCIINSEEELYVCKYCVTACDSEENIMNHIKISHRIKKRNGNFDIFGINEEMEDDDDLNAMFDLRKSVPPHVVRLTVGAIRFLVENRYCSSSTTVVYPPAYNWTIKFCKEHFSTLNLFPSWKESPENWKVLDKDIHKYLPPLKYSGSVTKMSVGKYVDAGKLDHCWKKYKLFESEIWDDGTSTIFCGGQIFAMAWLPTPFEADNIDQILAVGACSSSMDKLFTLDEVYSEYELIQFWNFGMLKNYETISVPKLDFCIAHNFGPVRILEWCPSGCYDYEPDQQLLRRLGLLAVGCTNSNIYIYSVSSTTQNSGKIFKPKPVLKLSFETMLEEPVYGVQAHVTKISWSKAAGHQFIATGYATGLVAVFDLGTKSALLRAEADSDGLDVLMPFRVIKAHLHTITALNLFHLNDGRRWVMTGSLDRSIKYWDLENPVVPISTFSRSSVTDGVWIAHWLSSLYSFDDCCGSAPTTSIIYQPRNFISEHSSTMYSNCHIWSVSGSEWTNGFIQGNVMGELQGFFPHQLFAGMENNKSNLKKKFMLSYINLVEKELSNEKKIAADGNSDVTSNKKLTLKSMNSSTDSLSNVSEISDISKLVKAEPLTYKEASDKYGIAFCDIKINSLRQCQENMTNYNRSKSGKFFNPQPNIYPLQSINKVAFNPNHSSHLYVAAAYQIGFVRVSRLALK